MKRKHSNDSHMVEERDYNTQSRLEAGIQCYFLGLGKCEFRENLKKLPERLFKIISKKGLNDQ